MGFWVGERFDADCFHRHAVCSVGRLHLTRRFGAKLRAFAATLDQPLDFLAPGNRYEATIYAYAAGADYRTNPTSLVVSKKIVTRDDALNVVMAPEGGLAGKFAPVG